MEKHKIKLYTQLKICVEFNIFYMSQTAQLNFCINFDKINMLESNIDIVQKLAKKTLTQFVSNHIYSLKLTFIIC